jgi:cytochrome c553
MQKTKHKLYRVMLAVCAIILTCVLSNACSSSKKTTTIVTSSPEETAWRTACSKCHTLDDANPRGYPASQWPRIVNRMQNKNGGNQFSDEQKDLIIKYLIANAIIKN